MKVFRTLDLPLMDKKSEEEGIDINLEEVRKGLICKRIAKYEPKYNE